MPKLKLQYFGHLMWRANSLEKTLMLGKTESRRRRGQQRMRWLNGITNSMDMSLRKFQEINSEGQESLACCSPWGGKESDMTFWLNNKVNDGHWTQGFNIHHHCVVVILYFCICIYLLFPCLPIYLLLLYFYPLPHLTNDWSELIFTLFSLRASLIAQSVKNLPAKQETPVWFLGWEDLLEKGQATHSSILGLPLWLSW